MAQTGVVPIEVVYSDKGAVTGLRALGREFGVIEGGAKRAGGAGNEAMRGLAREQQQAARATSFLTRSLGVELPRGLDNVIGKTKLIGPLMAAAFNASIIVAVGAALFALVPYIQDAASELGGFTKEMREVLRVAAEANKELLASGAKNVGQSEQAVNATRSEIDAIYAKIRANELVIRQRDKITDGDLRAQAAENENRKLEQRAVELNTLLNGQLKRRNELLSEGAQKGKESVGAIFPSKEEFEEVVAKAKQASEEQRRATEQLANARRQAALQGVDGEEAVRLKLAQQLEELRKIAQERPSLTQQVLATIVALEDGAQREITAIHQREQEKRVQEQKKAVDEFARQYQENIDRQRNLSGQLGDIEAEAAAARRRAAGDSLGAIAIEERRRIDQTIAGLRELGASEAQLAEARASLQQQANMRIADEHRAMVEQMADQWASLFDDLFSGNLGRRIISNAKRFFSRLLAQMVVGGGASGQAGSQSGGGGGLLSILFGGAGGGGGGLGGGVFGLPGTTPPFIPGNSFMPGGSFLGSGLASAGGSLGSTTQGSGGGGGALGLGGLLGGLFTRGGRGGAQGGLGLLGAMAGGGRAGGTLGMAGGGLAAIGVLAAMGNPAALAFASSLGIAPALFAGAAGGLLGFGVGLSHGPLAGGLVGGGAGLGLGALMAGAMGFGPVGIIVAGLIGLFAGIFGGLFGGRKRRKQAEAFTRDAVLPEIKKIVDAYKGHQLDFFGATSALEDIRAQAREQLGKLKKEGRREFDRQVSPALTSARSEIERIEAERQRRATLSFAPPQFHSGGLVMGGSMGGGGFRLASGEVVAILKRGEYVVNERSTAQNLPQLEAINRGGSGGGPVIVNLYPQRVDQQWLRNGGAREIAVEISREQREYRR